MAWSNKILRLSCGCSASAFEDEEPGDDVECPLHGDVRIMRVSKATEK